MHLLPGVYGFLTGAAAREYKLHAGNLLFQSIRGLFVIRHPFVQKLLCPEIQGRAAAVVLLAGEGISFRHHDRDHVTYQRGTVCFVQSRERVLQCLFHLIPVLFLRICITKTGISLRVPGINLQGCQIFLFRRRVGTALQRFLRGFERSGQPDLRTRVIKPHAEIRRGNRSGCHEQSYDNY